MSDKTYTLTAPDGRSAELPAMSGTVGPDVVNIGSLYKQLGIFTYDPGFVSTGSCESEITFIDGNEGVLMYRGYPVEQLAEHSPFVEVCYLLLNGVLPTADELDPFTDSIRRHTLLNESLLRFYNGFNHAPHPMAMVSGVVGSMSAFYPHSPDPHHPPLIHASH